jgi:signal transduction histidine kinase/ligand-binding sensor domain-containing protein/DNA-binding response OmpR family regulator
MKAFQFYFLVLLIGAQANAQSQQYKFKQLDINNGLSHNTIRCFYKDTQGFIWIGTVAGLNRFDGNSIRIFTNIPNDSTSLSDNEILKIFEDPEGNIWLNTWASDNIYDPLTERFSHNTEAYLNRYSIPRGHVSDIKRDGNGNFWFIHERGIFKYSPSTRVTTNFKHNPLDTLSIHSNIVSSAGDDKNGNLWLIHDDGVLECLNAKTGSVIYRNFVLYNRQDKKDLVFNLFVDRDGDLWIYRSNNNQGVFYFNSKNKTSSQISKNGARYKLNNDIVRGVVEDDQGVIWIATDHGGINLIDKDRDEVSYLLHNPEDERSIIQNSVNALYKDNAGFIWAGTYKNGVSYYHENLIRFKLFTHNITSRLPFNDINCFEEDYKGNLWLGTNGGGLIYYDRANNSFTSYVSQSTNENSLSSNVIVSLCLDHENKLWIGTFFGGLNSFDGKNFKRYKHRDANAKSIADDSIWEILEDNEGNLWIGTLEHGLDRFDRNTNSFVHFKTGSINSVRANYVPSMVLDDDNNLWIGTGNGLEMLDRKSGNFIQYLHKQGDAKSLSHNRIVSLLKDKRGLLWIGTREGLNVFNPKKKEFRLFTEKEGLPSNTIHTLLEDNTGNIWIGTPNGLSNLMLTLDKNLTIQSFEFRNYDESDGLQGKQFNEGAAFKTKSGELLFGGSNGFNAFRGDEININTRVPSVVLTDFLLFNKHVRTNETINGQLVLDTAISKTKSVVLKHNQNVFTIEFSTLDFLHPEKNKYKYKLEGFNKEWLNADSKSRKVTYTNLDPGEYIFKVIASNNDGLWNDKGLQLSITVLPPFWKSGIAFFIYVLILLGALLLARQMLLQRERMKFQIEQERHEAHRMHELDVMKTKFFTNVSHEFRTPLTLILTPLEKLLKNTKDQDLHTHLQLIFRNARRLLNLVNQLLDLRRIEVQELKYNPSTGDIIKFIHDIAHSFSDLSEKKNVTLQFESDPEHLETQFDRDKLERILFNLLSNALKFTPEGGLVSVLVYYDSVLKDRLEIKVKDNGIGIPADKQQKVFERFFQSDLPKDMVNQGSGIGLSITSEFVKIHGGSISLESEVGKGSCFSVLLPVIEIAVDRALVNQTQNDYQVSESSKAAKPTLLLVEDNEDFRFYLKDNLKSHYAILEASNGKDGLSIVHDALPDLIVSDVMMPVMNGIEMCKFIKGDEKISHIPIILLTARITEEQKLEGFETGADDYITKPFNFEILQSRIKNLIHQRELFHKDFRKQIEVKGSAVNITSLDEKLIKNAIKLVEDNLSNADFSVEDLSSALNMSRVHLYKKLMSLTGKSPIEFIRVIRLQRAMQLLEKSQLTVSEVAYQVGFNSPKYFAKYFKEEYKVLPSTLMKRHENSKTHE